MLTKIGPVEQHLELGRSDFTLLRFPEHVVHLLWTWNPLCIKNDDINSQYYSKGDARASAHLQELSHLNRMVKWLSQQTVGYRSTKCWVQSQHPRKMLGMVFSMSKPSAGETEALWSPGLTGQPA